MAGGALNRKEGWNPTSLGGISVHQQVTPTEWFDPAVDRGGPSSCRAGP